ncbi:MAG TPA: transglutaminaseTgpA domain-containing protein [Chloroflexia bacterium]|nr:transglutaminaseTgpA domain-containing protein [Chloroflexia bacterium]
MLRYFRLQEGWLTVGLLALLLFSVTLSIQAAQWSDGLSILTPITIVGLVTGLVLAKVRGVPRFLLDMVGLLVGVITVLVAVASVMREEGLVTIQERVRDLLLRTAVWIEAAISQQMSDDLLVFVLSLAVVVWVLSYSSAYFVFRSRQLWWALVPNGVALLINLSYSLYNLNGYIIVFMFAALLLMIRFNLLMKEERWQRERVNYSPGLTWAFLWAGSAISIVLAMAMWYVPATAVNNTLNTMWAQVNKPWLDFQNRMAELWSPVNSNQSIGGYSSFNKSFTMGGSLNLSDNVALVVSSPQRSYWRVRTWDEYTGIGWRSTAEETFHVEGMSSRLALDANQRLISQDELRTPMTYTVQVINPKGDLLFAALRPVQVSIPTRLEVSWRPLNEQYEIDEVYRLDPSLSSVPLELRSLIGLLHLAQRDLRLGERKCTDSNALECIFGTDLGPQIRSEIEGLNRRGVNVVLDPVAEPVFTVRLLASGEVPVYDDLSVVYAGDALSPGQEYTAISYVTESKEEDLRAAGIDYPDWVTSRYRSIPATVPLSVGTLAEQIVRDAGATTPYDMAKAIETHLRNNYEYSTSIDTPPSGVDRIQWFLFEGKKGYCEYYAGAMVLMLRHLGIPTRLAGGYAPGTLDTRSGAYVVKESAAHAWPEVYFPRYGWIEFEPTPSQAVITHREDPLAGVDVPSPEPTVGPEVSPTPRDLDRDVNEATRGRTNTPGAGSIQFPGGGLGLLVAAAIGVGLLALFFLPASPLSRNRQPADAGFYYRRMLLLSRLLRAGPAAHQTPFEYGESLSREVPGTTLFARTITRAYVRERYGRDPLDVDERRTLHGAYASLRGRLLKSLPARRLLGLTKRRKP